MAASIMIYMLGIALAGFVRLRMRYDRILSWLMFLGMGFLFIRYNLAALHQQNLAFSFLWNSTRIGDIMIDFVPSQRANSLIVPLFFISLMTIFNNNIFKYEEKRCTFNAYIILNFITLCLLICAQNYVQLITAVFVSDILGYLILKDVDATHRYVIYNLFADMCLFMILAMVCGRVQSLELGSLLNYEQIGRHKDFVGLVTAFALFVKMGFFLFQSYLFDLNEARFQRMSAVNLLFSPLSGLLLLMRLHNLLAISDLSAPLLKTMAGVTFVSGLVYFIIKNNIQIKTVSLNMAFIGLIVLMLSLTGFGWNTLFSFYLLEVYFFNLLIFKIYLYQNREEKVGQMINCSEINTKAMLAILVLIVLLINIFVATSYQLSKTLASSIPLVGSGGILIALCVVLNHIYKSPHCRRLDYLNSNPMRILSFIVNFMIIAAGGIYFKIFNWYGLFCVLVFLSLIAVPYWQKCRLIYEVESIQQEDVGNSLLTFILVAPFRYISKMLWLIVDFVFSERIITAAISSMNKLSLSFFFKINKRGRVAAVTYVLLGLAVFVLSFYGGILR